LVELTGRSTPRSVPSVSASGPGRVEAGHGSVDRSSTPCLAVESGKKAEADSACDSHGLGPRAALPLGSGACEIWGVLNVTPDSFSDGGAYLDLEAALARARRMVDEGAIVVDVGGESTRPKGNTYGAGAEAVSAAEEALRVLPVVKALVEQGIRVSVDTTKAEVAGAACQAGASVVNDVSCGASIALLRATAEAGAELVLMHNRGRGECAGENVRYADVVQDVVAELLAAVERAVAAGVARERIWLDPGLGFAKTAEQSLTLLAHTDVLVATGHRVLVGPSRKSFIAELARSPTGQRPPVHERIGGTAASVCTAAMLGAHAVRVHEVVETRQAALLGCRVREARG
jgi:dihydropteroate synthase